MLYSLHADSIVKWIKSILIKRSCTEPYKINGGTFLVLESGRELQECTSFEIDVRPYPCIGADQRSAVEF
jgi:hypothetical protein